MKKGLANENIILDWLSNGAKKVIDFREFRLAQRIDVDFGIETIDGNIVLAEIKSDQYVKESERLLFECFRINHFVPNHWFYLGWGWRSPAQKLIARNPLSGETFVFEFPTLRALVGQHVKKVGKTININVTLTDQEKTTFNFLIPMATFKGHYEKFIVSPPDDFKSRPTLFPLS